MKTSIKTESIICYHDSTIVTFKFVTNADKVKPLVVDELIAEIPIEVGTTDPIEAYNIAKKELKALIGSLDI